MSEPIPVMTGAELKAAREYLGLSWSWLAEHLGCDQRRLQRMELGQEVIPEVFAGALDDLYEETADFVHRMINKYRDLVERNGHGARYATYRTDTEYQRAHKHGRFQARWHRMVGQRVADAVPGVVLVYEEPHRVNKPPWRRDQGKQPHPEVPSQ